MRSEWKKVRLGDVCELVAGFAFKSNHFGDYPDKVLKIADINPPYVNETSLTGVDLLPYNKNKLNKFLVKKGDYALAMTGATIGKIGKITGKSLYLNQRVLTFRPNTKIIDKNYLYYVLLDYQFQPFILNHIDSQTAQPNISATSIGKYTFDVPPLPEQRAIATTLSCLDDKIEQNNKINANLEAQAQAIFKSWFVDFEPFRDGEFVASELGMIPKGWRVGLLSELINVKYGKDHKRLSDGAIPVYGSGGIMRYAEKALYERESVLIPRKGTLNNVVYINEPFWTVDTMFYSEMRHPHIAKFIYFLVSGKNLASMNSGSAVPSMTTDILNNLLTPIAPESIFYEYDRLVSPLFDAVHKNTKQSNTLAAIRDTLLPKLMSGEIEVPIDEL